MPSALVIYPRTPAATIHPSRRRGLGRTGEGGNLTGYPEPLAVACSRWRRSVWGHSASAAGHFVVALPVATEAAALEFDLSPWWWTHRSAAAVAIGERAVRPRQPHRQPAVRPDPARGNWNPPPGTRGSCRRFRRRASAPGPARRRADRFGPLDQPTTGCSQPAPFGNRRRVGAASARVGGSPWACRQQGWEGGPKKLPARGGGASPLTVV